MEQPEIAGKLKAFKSIAVGRFPWGIVTKD